MMHVVSTKQDASKYGYKGDVLTFTDIINNLKSLRKGYSNEEIVRNL